MLVHDPNLLRHFRQCEECQQAARPYRLRLLRDTIEISLRIARAELRSIA